MISMSSRYCQNIGQDECAAASMSGEGQRKTHRNPQCLGRCESYKASWSQQNFTTKREKLAGDRGGCFSIPQVFIIARRGQVISILELTDKSEAACQAMHVWQGHICAHVMSQSAKTIRD